MSADPVARGFDRLAPIYDQLGMLAFGGALQRSQRLWFPELAGRRFARALVAGGGTGRFSAALLEQVAIDELVSIDPSRRMTATSRRRLEALAKSTRLTFIERGLEAAESLPSCELICLPYVLDLFDEPALGAALDRATASAADGALALVTDFCEEPSLLTASLYRFFRLSCAIRAERMPAIDAGLSTRGWTALGRRTLFAGRMISTLWRR